MIGAVLIGTVLTGPGMIGTVLTGPGMIGTVLTGPGMIGTLLIDTFPIDTLLIDTGPPVAGLGSTMAVLLAAVFAVAAITKATDPSTTTAEFSQLRIPAAALMARLVPIVELTTAAALILQPRAGAAMATALLLAFTTVIGAAIRSGRSVSCGCLGPRSREPVSIVTVGRNLVLLAMAATAGAVTTLTMPDAVSIMTSLSLLLLAGVGLQLLTLRRKIGRLWSVELAGESPRTSKRETIAREGIAV